MLEETACKKMDEQHLNYFELYNGDSSYFGLCKATVII